MQQLWYIGRFLFVVVQTSSKNVGQSLSLCTHTFCDSLDIP